MPSLMQHSFRAVCNHYIRATTIVTDGLIAKGRWEEGMKQGERWWKIDFLRVALIKIDYIKTIIHTMD